MRSNSRSRAKASVHVIGIGNESRGDDAVGLCVAHTLAALNLHGVRVSTEEREGTALIAAWQRSGADTVLLVDAMVGGGVPGSVLRFDLKQARVPLLDAQVSTHGVGLAQAVELARMLGQLPGLLVLYAVEGKCFGLGDGLSPEVCAAVDHVVDCIRTDIGQ